MSGLSAPAETLPPSLRINRHTDPFTERPFTVICDADRNYVAHVRTDAVIEGDKRRALAMLCSAAAQDPAHTTLLALFHYAVQLDDARAELAASARGERV